MAVWRKQKFISFLLIWTWIFILDITSVVFAVKGKQENQFSKNILGVRKLWTSKEMSKLLKTPCIFVINDVRPINRRCFRTILVSLIQGYVLSVYQWNTLYNQSDYVRFRRPPGRLRKYKRRIQCRNSPAPRVWAISNPNLFDLVSDSVQTSSVLDLPRKILITFILTMANYGYVYIQRMLFTFLWLFCCIFLGLERY